MPAIRVTQEVRAEMIDMHTAGQTPFAIAKEMEVSLSTVYRVLRAAELEPNSAPGTGKIHTLGPEDIEDIIERYHGDETVVSILADYGLHYNQFYEILRMVGLQPRRNVSTNRQARRDQLDHAIELYRDTNMTIAEITLETGVHQPTLHVEIRKRNVPLRAPRIRRSVAPLTPKGDSDA